LIALSRSGKTEKKLTAGLLDRELAHRVFAFFAEKIILAPVVHHGSVPCINARPRLRSNREDPTSAA